MNSCKNGEHVNFTLRLYNNIPQMVCECGKESHQEGIIRHDPYFEGCDCACCEINK